MSKDKSNGREFASNEPANQLVSSPYQSVTTNNYFIKPTVINNNITYSDSGRPQVVGESLPNSPMETANNYAHHDNPFSPQHNREDAAKEDCPNRCSDPSQMMTNAQISSRIQFYDDSHAFHPTEVNLNEEIMSNGGDSQLHSNAQYACIYQSQNT